MEQESGLFIKLFRDAAVWEQSKDLFESAKEKLKSEEKRRKGLADEAGVVGEDPKPKFNKFINPSLFYPELEKSSAEFCDAWRNGVEENRISIFNLQDVPTPVLAEQVFFAKHRLFEEFTVSKIDKNLTTPYWIMYGIRGNKRYMVAWWGREKERYELIKTALANIENNRRIVEENKRKEAEAMEAEKLEEEKRREDDATAKLIEQKSSAKQTVGWPRINDTIVTVIGGFCLIAILFVVFADRYGWWPFNEDSVEVQIENPVEEAGIEHSSFCEKHTKNLPIISEERDLPDGKVMGRSLTLCSGCGTGMLYIIGERGKTLRVNPFLWLMYRLGQKTPWPEPIIYFSEEDELKELKEMEKKSKRREY